MTAFDVNWTGDDQLAADSDSGFVFTEGVIDHEGDGTLLGVDVWSISLVRRAEEPGAEELQQAGLVSVSIDRDADAIYLRVRNRSSTSRRAAGRARAARAAPPSSLSMGAAVFAAFM